MPSGRIKAVTFDLWNTIYSADNGSLDPVRPKRREIMRDFLASLGVRPSEPALGEAYSLSFKAYMAAWESGRHYGAREQVLFFLHHFGVDPSSAGEGPIAETARKIEDAAFVADLQLVPGIAEAVPALAELGYDLAVISDTSLTPGRVLREFLAKDGLLPYFSALSFSDETGYPKPDRRMFERTLAKLGVEPIEALHVGDTPRTDIAGAKALGMATARCAAVTDQPDPPPADFVIRHHRELIALLAQLS